MKPRRLLPVLTLALACAMPATAATISYSDSYAGNTNWNRVFSLGRFNPALGNLDAVEFVFDGGITTTFKFENRSTSSATSVTQSSSVTMGFGPPIADSLLLQLQLVTTVVPVFDGAVNYAGSSGYTTLRSTSGTMSKTLVAGDDDLSFFLGASPFTMSVSTTGTSSTLSGSPRSASIMTIASGAATVTYRYSQRIPEPATPALVAAALLAGWLVRRSRS